MNPGFGDGIPLPPISQPNRYKFLSRVALCSVVFIVLFTLSILLIFLFTIKFYAPPSSMIPGTMQTSSTIRIPNDKQLVESRVTIKVQPNSTAESLCIAQNVKYHASGEPFQNYTLYVFDATLLTPNTSISFDITIFGPDVGCTWSLDMFPMDGRTIPMSGRPTGLTAFGLYDEIQGSTIHRPNVSTVEYWGAGTGKFAVGINGAWYGSAGVGCTGAGKLVLCFS